MTSHAAVVARGMGKSCVVGCGSLSIDSVAKTITAGSTTLKEGDQVEWLVLVEATDPAQELLRGQGWSFVEDVGFISGDDS